jgi:peptidoglycan/LPS O-acetylase OafA/YrhL
LSGYADLKVLTELLSSEIAVKSFFIVSGFLIFMSYDRSPSLSSYFSKRFRRLYPACFTLVIACAFALLFISTKSVGEYFTIGWLKYVVCNLLFLGALQSTLPGVFEVNNIAAVNGALWTLKIEVMFYFAVPLFAWLFKKFSKERVMVTAYCLSICYASVFTFLAEYTGDGIYSEFARQLPGQLSYFMAGAFFYYYLPLLEKHRIAFVAMALCALIINKAIALPIIYPIALAALISFLAFFPYVGNFGKYGDYSYGVYISHFPIIQTLIAVGCFPRQPWLFLGTVVAATAIVAFILWNFVEKAFLSNGRHGGRSQLRQHIDGAPLDSRPVVRDVTPNACSKPTTSA